MSINDDVGTALDILNRDTVRLNRIQAYVNGAHDMPYLPDSATDEFQRLAKRAITNWIPTLVNGPVQAMYVDNFRRGDSSSLDDTKDSPEWTCWQRSSMDSRQLPVHRTATQCGLAFTLVTKDASGDSVIRGLSPFRTVALYDDPSVDIDPVFAIYVKKFSAQDGDGKWRNGVLTAWDDANEYTITYTNDASVKGRGISVQSAEPHGMTSCPVTPFTCFRDLEGRASGVVELLIPIQDRINQTIFDLLTGQSYTAHQVRTVTGMAPPIKHTTNEEGELIPLFDADGNVVPDMIQVNASRFLFAESPEVKFGALPGGELHGFIEAVETAIRHASAIAQVPPHFVLGQIANVSAEALEAAETTMFRFVEELQHTYGESWERTFRLVLELEGEDDAAKDVAGEVMWRDTGTSAISKVSDALGKLKENLDIPAQGLWGRVPGVTKVELNEWTRLAEEQDKEGQLLNQPFQLARTGTLPSTTQDTSQDATGGSTALQNPQQGVMSGRVQ